MKSVSVPKLLHPPRGLINVASQIRSVMWLAALALAIVGGGHEAYSDSSKRGSRTSRFLKLVSSSIDDRVVQLAFASKDSSIKISTHLTIRDIFGESPNAASDKIVEGYLRLKGGKAHLLQVLVNKSDYVEDLNGLFQTYYVATYFFKSKSAVHQALSSNQLAALALASNERKAAGAANETVAPYIYFEPGTRGSSILRAQGRTATAQRYQFTGRRGSRRRPGNCGCSNPPPPSPPPCARTRSCQPSTPPTTGGSICSNGSTPEECGIYNGPFGPGQQFCCSPLVCENVAQARCGFPTATPTATATQTPEEEEEEEELIIEVPETQQPPTQQPTTQQPTTQQPTTQQPPTQQPPSQQ